MTHRRADRRHSPTVIIHRARSPEIAGLVHLSPLRIIMKLSTRPFMVEIKNRKRATSPAMASSFTRRDDWLDPISPDALPQRDVHEDLTVAPAQGHALREAEKLFQGLRGGAQPAPAEREPTTAAISSGSEAVPLEFYLTCVPPPAKKSERMFASQGGTMPQTARPRVSPGRRLLLSRSGFLPLDLSSGSLRSWPTTVTLRRLWRSVAV